MVDRVRGGGGRSGGLCLLPGTPPPPEARAAPPQCDPLPAFLLPHLPQTPPLLSAIPTHSVAYPGRRQAYLTQVCCPPGWCGGNRPRIRCCGRTCWTRRSGATRCGLPWQRLPVSVHAPHQRLTPLPSHFLNTGQARCLAGPEGRPCALERVRTGRAAPNAPNACTHRQPLQNLREITVPRRQIVPNQMRRQVMSLQDTDSDRSAGSHGGQSAIGPR